MFYGIMWLVKKYRSSPWLKKEGQIILLHSGESTYRRNRERQETQNLKVFDVSTVEELI
jgi:hypothetical protein